MVGIYLTYTGNRPKKAVLTGGFWRVSEEGLGVLLGRTGGTLGDCHRAEAHEGNLGAGEHHEAAEGVGGFAVGGQADIEGGLTRGTEDGGRVDQEDSLLGGVCHEYRRVFGGGSGTGIGVAIPRDGQVLASGGDSDGGQLSRGSVADGLDFGEVNGLGVAVDDLAFGELLKEHVAARHALGRCREEELQLLVGELANEVQELSEEAALRLLCGGVGVPDGLRDATHVGDAVPAGADDGANLTFESTQDSLLDFTHSN